MTEYRLEDYALGKIVVGNWQEIVEYVTKIVVEHERDMGLGISRECSLEDLEMALWNVDIEKQFVNATISIIIQDPKVTLNIGE